MKSRLLALALVAAVLVLAWASGLFDIIRDEAAVRAAITGLGAWGYVLYVLAFALLEPFFVPGILFIVPASIVWPFPVAFGLSLLGSVGAGIVGFGLARFVARDWIAGRIPERLRHYDAALAKRGLRTVILVRLTLFLAPPAHYLLGLSSVAFAPMVIGSLIGFAPGIAALTFFGRGAVEWLESQPLETWGLVAVIGGAAIVLVRALRRTRSGRAPI